MQATIPVFYTLDSQPDQLVRAWIRLLQLAGRCRNRALVASDAPNLAARIAELNRPGLDRSDLDRSVISTTGADLELGFWSDQDPDPLTGSGWPAFALEVSPSTLLSLLEDRRVSAVIYVPRSAPELRHFTQVYANTSSL